VFSITYGNFLIRKYENSSRGQRSRSNITKF